MLRPVRSRIGAEDRCATTRSSLAIEPGGGIEPGT